MSTSRPPGTPSEAAGPPPRVEILAIGNELMLGETVDTNSAWIARRLAAEGIRVARVTLVGDVEADIQEALDAALRRSRTVLCTGGLGPTADDLTRHAVARLYERDLTIDEAWVDVLRERYRRRGIDMPAINRVQGERPEGATLLPNERGTAPGVAMDDPAHGLTVLLPGVPAEMRGLMDAHVVPLLRQRLRPVAPVVLRVLRTTGISEAALAERVADVAAATGPVDLAFLPQVAGVDLRLSCATRGTGDEGAASMEALAAALRERLGLHVYAEGSTDLATVVGTLLRQRGMTVALAESCTGGLVAKRLTDDAGASDYLGVSWVTYSNDAKAAELKVSAHTLARHGAVSEQCAREMAEGARAAAAADVAVSITGVAGPGGGSEAKPVGTVWIAIAMADGTRTAGQVFGGARREIRERSAQAALDLLRRALLVS